MARSAQTQPSQRIDINYGVYRIIAGAPRGTPRAVAYAGDRPIEAVTDADVDATVRQIKSVLDSRLETFQGRRVADVPTTEEFHDLLASLPNPWIGKLRPILQFHAGRFPEGATIGQLSRACGSDLTTVWHHYGRFGRKVISALRVPAPKDVRLDPNVLPVMTFARLTRSTTMEEWTVSLRPELLAALGNEGVPGDRTAPL